MIQVKKSEQEISAADYEKALHSVYRVWMLTPHGDAATLVEYEMDQEALEEMVEDYTRFAEIVVRIDVRDDSAVVADGGVAEDAASEA
ncbi:MAG TPA: hypothetical protein VFJ58_00140 [Armatimonadota bacterium]|nr:hypothetical protein [Armatimonadota bacterium]